MRLLILTALGIAMCGSAALADEKVTDDEATKIKDAVAAFGCEGGKYQKESEGTGVLQADDVKCKSGNYDFRLTKDYKVFAITMD